MTASSVFKEVISQGLSPVVLTGPSPEVFTKFIDYIKNSYTEDKYLLISSLTAHNISEFKNTLTLKATDLKFVLVIADNVSFQTWQKLLKTLEDCTPNTQLLIISTKSLPQSVMSRSFRCHIPLVSEEIGQYSGTEAFSVGSWLISVDTRNREQLLKSCQDWSNGHTDLLIAEINEQLSGNSLLQLNLDKRLSNPNKLMAALYMINDNLHAPTAPLYTGLRLMI